MKMRSWILWGSFLGIFLCHPVSAQVMGNPPGTCSHPSSPPNFGTLSLQDLDFVTNRDGSFQFKIPLPSNLPALSWVSPTVDSGRCGTVRYNGEGFYTYTPYRPTDQAYRPECRLENLSYNIQVAVFNPWRPGQLDCYVASAKILISIRNSQRASIGKFPDHHTEIRAAHPAGSQQHTVYDFAMGRLNQDAAADLWSGGLISFDDDEDLHQIFLGDAQGTTLDMSSSIRATLDRLARDIYRRDFTATDGNRVVRLADINNDGQNDAIVWGLVTRNNQVQEYIAHHLNRGFYQNNQPQQVWTRAYLKDRGTINTTGKDMIVAKVNNDNYPDLIFAHEAPHCGNTCPAMCPNDANRLVCISQCQANCRPHHISLFFGNQNGFDAYPAPLSQIQHNNQEGHDGGFALQDNHTPVKIAAGDYDGDGDQDLAAINVENDGSTNIQVYRNDGQGNFSYWKKINQGDRNIRREDNYYFVHISPFSCLEAADLDLDGKTDLITCNENQKSVSFLLDIPSLPDNTPLHTRRVPDRGPLPGHDSNSLLRYFEMTPLNDVNLGDGGFKPSRVAVGDLNGDGFPDVIVALPHYYLTGESLAMLVSQGGRYRSWAGPNFYDLHNVARFGALDVAIADINGDSWNDIIGLQYWYRFGHSFAIALNEHDPAHSITAQGGSFSLNLGSARTYRGQLRGTSSTHWPLVYTIVSPAQKGTVRMINSQTGDFEYMANANIVSRETDTFRFNVDDGVSGHEAVMTVSLIPAPVRTRPTPPVQTSRPPVKRSGEVRSNVRSLPPVSTDTPSQPPPQPSGRRPWWRFW